MARRQYRVDVPASSVRCCGDPLAPSSDAEAASATFDALGGNARPLGDAAFLARAESLLGRSLAPRRPGRKPGAERAKAGVG